MVRALRGGAGGDSRRLLTTSRGRLALSADGMSERLWPEGTTKATKTLRAATCAPFHRPYRRSARARAPGRGSAPREHPCGRVEQRAHATTYGTIRMMEAGIKPVFVFDGKPPTMKGGQLAKWKERQQLTARSQMI